MRQVELVLITGFSGAGKSEAMAAFEDSGYFCIDNLPPRMIGALGELFEHEGSKVERAAIACDVRGGEYFEGLLQVLHELAESGLRGKPTVIVEMKPDVDLSGLKEEKAIKYSARLEEFRDGQFHLSLGVILTD